ncbi:MAG TPA: lysine decarboxylase, partial [Candidimonas sp.]|nr:lysine decarboxylase [Candidimonas sp.]
MITELLNFKRLYDMNAPLRQAIPQLVENQPVYDTQGLRDFCDDLHGFYREHKVPEIMREMYTVLPEPVMRPTEAYEKLVRGEVETVSIDALAGRIAAAMLVPYPPGIPLIMPGERYAAKPDSLQNYIKLAPLQDARFPGFESDIHGLIIDNGP